MLRPHSLILRAASPLRLWALAAAAPAFAQIKGMNLRCEMDPQGIPSVTDLDNNRTLLSSSRQSVWNDGGETRALKPAIAFEPRPDGFTVRFTFVNDSPIPRTLGVITVPGIRFGHAITQRDFFAEGKTETIDHKGQNYFGGGLVYPEAAYAPVAVVSSDGYTIGASLQYPILEYKHRLFIRAQSPGGVYIYPNRNWEISFHLNPRIPEGAYSPEGEIAPGETRLYTLSVRILKDAPGQHQSEWLRTLEPYRQYFHSLYGPVRYKRDPRPMLGASVSTPHLLTPDNPFGFNTDGRLRADRYGFGPWAELLGQLGNSGWRRVTLWTPSGLFLRNRALNYPFQFTSNWRAVPNMDRSVSDLRSFADSGGQLGLWWGRSTQVMNSWDTANFQLLDPANPEHRRLAFAEMDGALRAGATLVGLDTFNAIPLWKNYPWLLELRQRYPTIRFIVERAACDVLHTIAASYALSVDDPALERVLTQSPHFLADFLNPGHETWGAIHTRFIRTGTNSVAGAKATPDQLHREMRRVAAMGYVPHPFTKLPLAQPYEQFNAAESWGASVPEGDQETLAASVALAADPAAIKKTKKVKVKKIKVTKGKKVAR